MSKWATDVHSHMSQLEKIAIEEDSDNEAVDVRDVPKLYSQKTKNYVLSWLKQLLTSLILSIIFFAIFYFYFCEGKESTSNSDLFPHIDSTSLSPWIEESSFVRSSIEPTIFPTMLDEDMSEESSFLRSSIDPSISPTMLDEDLRDETISLMELPLKYRKYNEKSNPSRTYEFDTIMQINRDPFDDALSYESEDCLANMEEGMECIDQEMLFYLNEQLTCAGLPIGDICILPRYSDLNNAEDTHTREGNLCSSIEETMVGHNDHGFWVPKDCVLLDTTPKNLISKMGNTRIALIGDSHIRNMFEGFLCEVRKAPLCPDLKIHNGFHYYHFSATHDEFVHIEDKELIYDMNFEENEVHIIFFWMPHWDDLDTKLLDFFRPDVMVASVAGWEKTKHDSPEWRAELDKVFLKHDVKKFIFAEFPWGGGERKKEFILPWIEGRDFMEFYSMKDIYGVYDQQQTFRTWHTMCQIMDDGKIKAFDLCTGSTERNQARIMLTSFFHSLSKKFSDMHDIRPVDIAEGTWKYVLIDLSKKGEYIGSVVRSYAGLEFHEDMFKRAMQDSEVEGLHGEVRGGGRITRGEADIKIEIYGYSKTFGRCEKCNEEAAKMIEKEFPDSIVTWSNEGY